MTANPKETAEDRWEFNQQSEALYQARLEAKATLRYPPLPVSPDGQEALLSPRQSGDANLPMVSQTDEE